MSKREPMRRRRNPFGGLLLPTAVLMIGAALAASALPAPEEPSAADPPPIKSMDTLIKNISSQAGVLPVPASEEPNAEEPTPVQPADRPSGSVSSQADVLPVPPPGGAGLDRESDWRLRLVNPWNPLPEDYSLQTVELRNGLLIDERCYPDLQDMMDACRAEGLSPVICSAYRTWEYQEQLFRSKVERCLSDGISPGMAEAEAGKSVAVPGTSEHQLGLAVDIVDINNQLLDASQEDTVVQKWLMAHSWEYGFILRYPNEKSELTGIIYEPWHYRYVGRETAEEIFAQGVCLEEYLGGLSTSP